MKPMHVVRIVILLAVAVYYVGGRNAEKTTEVLEPAWAPESMEIAAEEPQEPAESPSPLAPGEPVASATPAEQRRPTKRFAQQAKPVPAKPLTDQGIYNTPSDTLIARHENGRWVSQGDILIDEAKINPDVGDEEASLATIDEVSYWSDRHVPYEIDAALETGSVMDAIEEMNDRTIVKFVERTNEPDYVVFRRAEPNQEVCQSYLGRKGGEQEIVVHPTCSKGQLLHEMMHALGFVHEHSREDRDQFIEIVWENIVTRQKNQFQMLPAKVSVPVEVRFDFDSVLLYPPTAFSSNGQRTIAKKDGEPYTANRARLSELDVYRINTLYR